MKDTYYLLDMGALEETDADKRRTMIEKMEALLDQERLLKYRKMKVESAAWESLGAGAILQLIAGEYSAGEMKSREKILRPEDLLRRTEELDSKTFPRPLEYRYSEHGKPYFKELPLQFSLSHSDKIIFCAVSDEEIGADIQELSQMEWRSLADRFYAPKEKELLHRISEEQEGKKQFYGFWTMKEAFGKLTGQGIPDTLEKEVADLMTQAGADCRSWELEIREKGYLITVCRKMAEAGSGNACEEKK